MYLFILKISINNSVWSKYNKNNRFTVNPLRIWITDTYIASSCNKSKAKWSLINDKRSKV